MKQIPVLLQDKLHNRSFKYHSCHSICTNYLIPKLEINPIIECLLFPVSHGFM